MFISPIHLLKYKQTIKFISTSINVYTQNHYETLGISPKATQRDVKSAYYKLSMLYHPDKNTKSESAQKFRKITDAYEVLGNVKLRRLYDRGISHIGLNMYDTNATDDNVTKFYKSRERRQRPPSTGRTPIYNFDEWTRAHYGATFAREMELKKRMAFSAAVTKEHNETQRQMKLNTAVLFIFMAYIIFFGSVLNDHDKPVVRSSPSKGS